MIRTFFLFPPLLGSADGSLLLLRLLLVHVHLVLVRSLPGSRLHLLLWLCRRSCPRRAILTPQVHTAPLAEREDTAEEREDAAAEHGRRAGVGEPAEEVVEHAEEDECLALLRDHAHREAFRVRLDPGEDVRA